MEIKKSKKADLEGKRSLFFQLGLMVALGLTFVAFEWTTTDVGIDEKLWTDEEIIEEEAPPITRQDQIKPPPPPPPPPQLTDIIVIVENDVELDEELEIENTELDEDYEVDFSQLETEEEDSGDPLPFFVLEEKPEFPGGEAALQRFIASHVRYPVICQENGIQGMVTVSFVIDEKGRVTDVKPLRAPDANLEREAVRVVSTIPDWKPGKQRGRAVKVSYNVPVRFVLQ